ncbi:MAG: protein kinase domain-containing protein [Thermoanaerobaculia bacterium]
MIARGTRLGPYEIGAPLGAGGMGEVYQGRDTRLDRSVAIKILPPHLWENPELKMRFEREARAISGLNHPHICVLHDVGEARIGVGAEASLSYLVMELCDGQTMADRLARGPLPLDQVLRYGIEIADGLDRAHRSGITHRDLKPGNIMLTKSGTKLLDFGLAKERGGVTVQPDGATEFKPVTQEGTLIGTFQYMAPEQIEGLEADHRSDIFAFGALLYEMLTGKRAFDGKSKASVIAAILEREPMPLSELDPLGPPALERVIRTCLAKDPDERWQSAHDLRKELEWVRDGLSSPQPSIATGRRSRERAAWMAAALLPLLAAAGTWLWLGGSAPEPRRLVAAVAPPAGTEFVVTGDAGGPVILSPDGRSAAFVATSEQGPLLYVQSLESGITKALSGTEKAMFPFWSPDGRSLGYFAAGQLFVIDVDGSRPRAIADAADGRGGAWTAGGTILYTPYTQAPVMAVPADGGSPVAITRLEAPYTTHRWPSVHPDGKHFLYLAALHSMPESPDTAIFMATLDGKETRKIVASPGNGAVWGDWLLYLRANKLIAQRLKDGLLEGSEVAVWDDVLYDGGTWRAIFSVSSTGLLATHRQANANGNTVLSWFDRSGTRIGEIGPPALYRDVALSPDGRMAAMTIGDPGSAIYLHDLERGSRTRFSFVPGGAGDPLWTPDGRHVIFGTTEAATFKLFIKPADGSSGERTLLESPELLRPSSITPDGGYLIFERGTGPDGDVMRIPLAGGEPDVLVGGEGQQYEGKISPNGKWLAYIASDHSGRNLYVTSHGVGGGKWQISNEPAYATWWNPNGKELLYVSAYGIRSVDLEFDGGAVRAGKVTPLFAVDLNTNDRGLSMSPDGTRFLVVPIRQSTAGSATLITNFDLAMKK